MALATDIAFDDPRKYPPLLRLSAGIKRPDVRKVMGRRIATDLRKYFSRLDSERPNALGGDRTHYWGQVRRSVQQPELTGGDGLKVAITHVGASWQYYGGDMFPVTKQWLTVPARTEAYGHRAGEFDDLHFVFFRNDLAALVQNEQTIIPDQNAKRDRRDRLQGPLPLETTGGGIFYWLVKHVHKEPDPTVLPPPEDLEAGALESGEEYIGVLIDRENEK